MTCLVALISSGKGTWGQVLSTINAAEWDKVFLVCNEFTYDKFNIEPNKAIKLKIDTKNIEDSYKKLSDFLKKEIKDLEIAVNLSSGDGIEHMAVISAVLRAGLALRLVYADPQLKEIKEFEIFDQKFVTGDEDEF
jgi:fructose-1,6-bisphosphatase/sedoheptulose 1,7-bisphosphatase-like protein